MSAPECSPTPPSSDHTAEAPKAHIDVPSPAPEKPSPCQRRRAQKKRQKQRAADKKLSCARVLLAAEERGRNGGCQTDHYTYHDYDGGYGYPTGCGNHDAPQGCYGCEDDGWRAYVAGSNPGASDHQQPLMTTGQATQNVQQAVQKPAATPAVPGAPSSLRSTAEPFQATATAALGCDDSGPHGAFERPARPLLQRNVNVQRALALANEASAAAKQAQEQAAEGVLAVAMKATADANDACYLVARVQALILQRRLERATAARELAEFQAAAYAIRGESPPPPR